MKHALLISVSVIVLLSIASLSWAQNRAVQFDGDNDHVQVSSSLGIGSTYTAEAWIYPTSLTGTGDILTFGRTVFSASSASGSYPLWLTVLGTDILYRTWTASSTDRTINAGLTTNTWYHIAVTSTKGGTTRLYLNGIQIDSYTNAGTTSWPSTYTVGAIRPVRPNSILAFQGRIDDVRVWNTVRSATDIMNNIYMPFTTTPSGLVGYWKYDESSGTTASDSAGTAQNGTLANGASFTTNSFVFGLFYRTKANGNWNSPGSWECSQDGNTWVNAAMYPQAPNYVAIRTGHAVALNANAGCLDMSLEGGSISMGTYSLTIDGTLTETSGSISGGSPTVDGYAAVNNYLSILEDGVLISGFSASTSVGSNMPAKIDRQWDIGGSYTGNKTVTFFWNASEDNSYNWSGNGVIPSVYKGATEYTQTAYNVGSDPRWVTVTIPTPLTKGTYQIGPANDQTLPVELSSFAAILTADFFVKLHWTTQSETGVSGFYIYRGLTNDIAEAISVSPLIDATNSTDQHSYEYIDTELFEPGTYYYWLSVQNMDGSVDYHGPTTVYYDNSANHGAPGIPILSGLNSVYPNPFNPSTTIAYGLNKDADVSFIIYNSRGQIVRRISEGQKAAGNWKLTWNGLDDNGITCSTGVYYIKMSAGKDSFVKKAVLLK